MRKFLVAVLLAALALVPAALATTSDPRLDAVASRFAGQPVDVLCYAKDEPESPEFYDAWGYVLLDVPVVHLGPEPCEGALALLDGDPAVDAWKKALGALVLTHEAYHLALRHGDRGDEARTECRAVRHVRYAMRFLGATEQEASALMGWALALHWRLAAKVPEYHLKDCAIPNPW